jgi:hypothetical protein
MPFAALEMTLPTQHRLFQRSIWLFLRRIPVSCAAWANSNLGNAICRVGNDTSNAASAFPTQHLAFPASHSRFLRSMCQFQRWKCHLLRWNQHMPRSILSSYI